VAELLWGNVYYQDLFAGVLREEPGSRSSFTYDTAYLNLAQAHPLAHTLPLQEQTFICEKGLPAFFDNLIAEGWLQEAQSRLLGKRLANRFELLLAFGQDCAGAVSVIDPEPKKLRQLDLSDPKEAAVLLGRASLSGIQPKLAITQRQGKFYPAHLGELSTHIAKFPSRAHDDLVFNEYLTTLAFKALLPDDDIVTLSIDHVEGFSEPALIVERFDRHNGQRLHFEEFNQLLNYSSSAKYDGSYQEMADFMRQTPTCLPTEIYRLYERILAGLLLGNTDMHFKNFALFHSDSGLRLTPSYDQVSAVICDYKTIALTMAGSANRLIHDLKSKHIVALAKEFQLSNAAVSLAYEQLAKRQEAAKDAISQAKIGTTFLKKQIIQHLDKRWNATFTSIGKLLSTKR